MDYSQFAIVVHAREVASGRWLARLQSLAQNRTRLLHMRMALQQQLAKFRYASQVAELRLGGPDALETFKRFLLRALEARRRAFGGVGPRAPA